MKRPPNPGACRRCERDADLLHASLRAQFPDKQVTVLYDRIADLTTVRIDPRGLRPEVYYLAALADEAAGSRPRVWRPAHVRGVSNLVSEGIKMIKRFKQFRQFKFPLFLLLLPLLACQGEGPTTPPPAEPTPQQHIPPEAGQIATPLPAATPAPSAPSFSFLDSSGAALLRNPTTEVAWVTYCVFELLNGNFDTQALRAEKTYRLPPGTTTRVAAGEVFSLPQTCGKWQADLIVATSCGQAPKAHAGPVADYIFLEQKNCPKPEPTPTPNPTPTPTPPPCVPVWTELPPVYSPWGECSPDGTACSISRSVTIYEKSSCGPETVRVKKVYVESTPCPCQPTGIGICHVSNKGGKDGQVNLVLSPKQDGTGHEFHLDSSKFCPPDHRGECSCEKAKADAIACGVPVPAKGFECKIEGRK